MTSLVVLPAAADEIEETALWYAQRSPRAAANFVDRLSVAVNEVRQNPERYKQIAESSRGTPIRQHRVARYPYGVIYLVSAGRVAVLAVPYLGRRPLYWLGRAGGL